MPDTQLEPVDWQLLHLLADDARAPLGDLAAGTGLAEADVEARLERLRACGAITGVHARVDPARLGLPLTAFFMIRVAQTAEAYRALDTLLGEIDQVEEAHAVSGQFDWIVKVRAASPKDLRDLLTRRLAVLPGFVRAETMVVMSTSRDAVNVDAALHPRSV